PEAVPVRGRAREPDRRRGDARADPLARDPARVDRGLDLTEPAREAPGDRHGRRRAAPVPLPPGLSRGPGPAEVRPSRPVRRAAPRPAPADRPRSRTGPL